MLIPTSLSELARAAVLCLSAGAVLTAAAAGQAALDQVVAVKGKQIEVFAVPDDTAPGATVAVAALPWAIKEEKNSFYRVAVNGKDVWIDSMQVSVARGSSDNCSKLGRTGAMQPGSIAGVPGAGPARCK